MRLHVLVTSKAWEEFVHGSVWALRTAGVPGDNYRSASAANKKTPHLTMPFVDRGAERWL
jgi:hypothetical protein